ncbi:alkane hydroxylase MAH1-like [Lotus japonicus]|uniref:alkane hydroxylase MAH1-like n=1 Tax=Lotus japonicus TaxID=34305 RepID=UPI00258DF543|nr:alkane hydroxylase MAH1-like [Lotus japonicus]
MAILSYAAIIAALLCFLYIFHRKQCCRYPLLVDYPLLGMLPPLLWNLWRVHDFVTDILKIHGGTGEFTGPWFTKMDFMLTSDPTNVHHMMSKSFDNYVKGPEFREIFEAFGHGIFTADSEIWKYNRSLFHTLFKNRNFEALQERVVQKKVQSTLLPILSHVQKQGTEVDLQDVFNRFTFDNICSIVLGCDPNCLSIDFPDVACEKAFNEIEECIFYRHTLPKCVWKLQKWFQIGEEKKMSEACTTFNQFILERIASKRKELSENERDTHDFLTILMREEKGQVVHDDKFLRDAIFNLFVAGRDTITSALTWFFWVVATNPSVEAKILEELKDNNFVENEKMLGVEDVKKLVYLHGVICESLRLFPPIPFERKQAIESDVFPSGHHVNANAMILIPLYTMGRSEDVWGKDCLEFKPERWVSERGSIVHAPSYKFISFNAGPRTCLGKDLSFIQLKIIATAVLRNYRVHPVEGHAAIPNFSIVLLMQDGLKVRITKREN